MPNPSNTAVLVDMWPTLVEHHGVAIKYRRDGGPWEDLDAVKGRRTTDQLNSEYTESIVSDDWMVLAIDLETAGFGQPKRHDEIQWTDDFSKVRTFQVQMPGSERQWDWVDPGNNIMRIHTQEVKT